MTADSSKTSSTVIPTATKLPPPSYAKPIILNGSKGGDRTFKLIKSLYEENKSKNFLRGVKFVNKAVRTKKSGFVVIAADTYPLDVVAHLPLYCQEFKVPYIFLERRSDIGRAMFSKRSIVALFVTEPKQDSKNRKAYEKVLSTINKKATGAAGADDE